MGGDRLHDRRGKDKKKGDSVKPKRAFGKYFRAAVLVVTLPFLAAGLAGCNKAEKDKTVQTDTKPVEKKEEPKKIGEHGKTMKMDIKSKITEPEDDLHNAIDNKDLNKVKELLDNGAEIGGEVFLELARTACGEEGMKIFKLLMKHGGDEIIKKHGIGALNIAIYQGNKEVAKILIFEGVDINKEDEYSNVPLISAIKGGADFEIVKLLVENGADVNVVDGTGALENAYLWGGPELVKYLLDEGAKK